MKFFLAAVAASLIALTGAASASCSLTTEQVVAHSPFFFSGNPMVRVEGEEGLLSFSHKDDPRIVVAFDMHPAMAVTGMSRSEYVEALEKRGRRGVEHAKSQGRWADHVVFPYDPVSWRTVEELQVEGIGDALMAEMNIRLSPSCELAAYVVAPASANLRSRWNSILAEIANMRTQLSPLMVVDAWEPEDTTPTGVKAIAGGLVSPLGVIGLIYLLLGHLRRLDPPGVNTRVVLGSAAAVSAGTLLYQFDAYRTGLEHLKYVDSLLLLSFVAVTAAAGTALAQRAALFGLVSAGVAGIALCVASALGWTPDSVISLSVGASLVVMGLFGFHAWSEGSLRSAT